MHSKNAVRNRPNVVLASIIQTCVLLPHPLSSLRGQNNLTKASARSSVAGQKLPQPDPTLSEWWTLRIVPTPDLLSTADRRSDPLLKTLTKGFATLQTGGPLRLRHWSNRFLEQKWAWWATAVMFVLNNTFIQALAVSDSRYLCEIAVIFESLSWFAFPDFDLSCT